MGHTNLVLQMLQIHALLFVCSKDLEYIVDHYSVCSQSLTLVADNTVIRYKYQVVLQSCYQWQSKLYTYHIHSAYTYIQHT